MYDGLKREKNFKVCVVGERNTGKSCLVQQYFSNKFPEDTKPTPGSDTCMKSIKISRKIKALKYIYPVIQFCDVAGDENLELIAELDYKGSVGSLVVFDLSNYETFKKVLNWKKQLDTKVRPVIDGYPIVLVGNKSDLPRDPLITNKELKEVARKFSKYIEVSAKLNKNVDKAVRSLADLIFDNLEKGKFELSKDLSDSIKLHKPSPNSNSNSNPNIFRCC